MSFNTLVITSVGIVCLVSSCPGQSVEAPLTERERQLLDRIARLEDRLSAIEGKVGGASAALSTPAPALLAAQTSVANPDPAAPFGLTDTTLNFYFDGYYMWSTNRPLGRINLLRAYDATANNFSINQTGMMVERIPNVAAGRRWGYRLDLMYGQATEILQGNAQNEPRPQAYRPLFQGYGTYIAPIGKGLTVDYGKWASALGFENNYNKDQINYSRSYFFHFLPFYHMGFRNTYTVNDKLSLGYWLVNGTQQAEDFNNFKSQVGQAVIKPSKKLVWTLQYYAGQEQRDLVPDLNPGIPMIPTQPGLSNTPVPPPIPNGRLHIIDTYATWNVTNRLTLGGQIDYIINRVQSNSPPQRVTGGAAYLRYQMTPKTYFGQRYVRFNDLNGLFSGVAQSLNDVTSTLGVRVGEGFETRFEYRCDFSNVPFFYSSNPAVLKKAQNTFTLGLLWWFGGKEGTW